MSRKHSIRIGDTVLSIGDTLKITEKGQHDGHGGRGTVAKIHIIKQRDSGSYLIGIVAELRNENWSNLDGEVSSGYGYFFRRRDILHYFLPTDTERMVVKDSFIFKKLELQGLECDILAFLPDDKSVFIQFDKHVGGCGCDGLGKAGHCLAVPRVILKKVEKSKNKKKKA